MRRLARALAFFAVLAALGAGAWWGSWSRAPLAPPASPHPFFVAPRPLIWAHQGASHDAPPNTFAAFDRALELGADVLETDLRLSQDGVVVLFHDGTLERRTVGNGNISEKSSTELLSLDAGYRFVDAGGGDWTGRGARIPTLAAFLERYSPYPELRFSLELKTADPQLADKLSRMIR